MTSARPREALYRTLRFAMRDDMPEEMARAIFDRAIHCLPQRWVVTKISPAAVGALQANDYRKEGIALERAHKRQRNIWQREMLRWLRDDDPSFGEWEARLRDNDQCAITTRAENRGSDTLSEAFMAKCIEVPGGLFASTSHSAWRCGYAEAAWLRGLCAAA